MPSVESLILIGGVLVLLSILASTLSGKLGIPGLVLFLAVGMLAGEDGIVGLPFDDYAVAHAVGTVALVLILFDGGLQTPWRAFRRAWRPAVALSTVGVVITVVVTGLAATWLLDLPLAMGLLLGAIVGSTDAAAVFGVLRGQGLRLKERIGSTLEIESGSNDPMAVLLTVALIAVVTGEMEGAGGLALFFGQQAVLGAVGGVAVGWLGARTADRIQLRAPGLYPALSMGVAFLAFGLPAFFGGSGFLAVYLAGLVMGNSRLIFKRGILLAHDGAAWVAQIVMFVVLGLLATPSRLVGVWWEGLLVAGVLILVARPLAVGLTLLPMGFRLREVGFISWAGLKGAIPIILAIYPLLAGLDQAQLLFDVVFFVVLVSALSQGWTLPRVARWLGVRSDGPGTPAISLELTSLRHLEGDIVEYLVQRDAPVAKRPIRDLNVPSGAVISMIVRDDEVVPPRGDTCVLPGDYVFVIMRQRCRETVDRLFSPDAPSDVLQESDP